MFYRISEVSTRTLPPALRLYREPVGQVVQWLRGLREPHPDLGRPGPVCPFVGTAIDKDLVFLDIYDGPIQEREAVYQMLRQAGERFFGKIEPLSGEDVTYKNLLILFPLVPQDVALSLMDDMQDELIDEWAARGRMIGEFHPGSTKSGLWNKDFRPFYCPVPLLAMRRIFSADIYFLRRKEATTRSYLEHFKLRIPERLVSVAAEAAARYRIDFGKYHTG